MCCCLPVEAASADALLGAAADLAESNEGFDVEVETDFVDEF